MNWIKLTIWYLVSIPILLLLGDFVLSNLVLESPAQKSSERAASRNGHHPYRIYHPYFSHTFRENFDGYDKWGRFNYRVCTDSFGFKTKCDRPNGSNEGVFDIAFIGDSFTEAVGMRYEQSFVGLFAAKNTNLNIANLGVSAYSPSVYLKKVEYLLQNGINFEHLIVFIDISDIQNEARDYTENADGSVTKTRREFRKKNFLLTNILAKKIRDAGRNFRRNYSDSSKKYKETLEDRYKSPRQRWTYDMNSKGYGIMGVQGGIDKSIHYMERLYQLLHDKGIKLSVGVYPWPAQLVEMSESDAVNLQSQIWQNFCQNKCEYFIDVFPKFRDLVGQSGAKQTYKDYYIDGDVHFNEAGNRIIYEALLETFAEKK